MANRLELTQAYHKVSGSTLEAAAQAARSSFLSLGSWREDDIPRFIEQVVPSMNNAKRNMANYATNYYKEIAGIAGEKFKMPKIDPASLTTEALRNGATEDMIWSRPFKSMWTSLSKGDDFSDALEAGARRAVDLARTDVQLARRGAGLQARSRNDRIVGYVRTLSGSENCALCYVASTQRYKKKDLLPIHPGCDCGEMPIYGKDDPGQIIDDIRLEATHDAVETRFGISDRGAREPDYRKIAIQDNGELGPVLTVRGEKFTKLTPSQVKVPIKAPKKVEPKPFQKRIEPKLAKINGTKIADDIRAEHGDVFVPSLKGKNKIQTLGPKTSAYLDDVKLVGKDIDNEISKRVNDAISQLADPAEIASAQKQIKLADELIAKAKLELEAGIQQQVAVEQAKLLDRADKRVKELLADGFDQQYVDNYLQEFFSPEKVLRKAKEEAEYKFQFTPLGRKLRTEIKEYEADIAQYKQAIPANIVPGTERYNQLYAAKTKELLEEVRDVGQGGPSFAGSQKVNDILDEAKQVYPTDWLTQAAERFEAGITTKSVSRGYWNKVGRTIAISFDKQAGFKNGYATAVHEMGHMFEDSVSGLKELEYAFAHQRAALGTKRTNLGSKEVGFQDQWRNLYSGKDYGYNPDSSYEIFTTGVESVFGGSNLFQSPRQQSKYFNPSLGPNAGTDDEFRQFVLGVLFSL